MKVLRLKKSVLFLIFLVACVAYSEQLAFPTAEGGGKFTDGGRGGKVMEVTNLNDDGPGSFREAVAGHEKKTVVFRVSGTIILERGLDVGGYTTIAGQTAPGDGITLRKYPIFVIGEQVIMRYIRVRLGDEAKKKVDAITAREFRALPDGYQYFGSLDPAKAKNELEKDGMGWHDVKGPVKEECTNLIFDHVTTSWSLDESFSVYHCPDVTIQWCLLSESLNQNKHAFGAIWGGRDNNYHHNLIVSHASRNVRFCGGTENCDYRNNVCFNWGYRSIYGGENCQNNGATGKCFDRWKFSSVNVVGNFYKKGPASTDGKMAGVDGGSWYFADNAGVTGHSGGKQLSSPVEVKYPIKEQSAEDAYKDVLAHAGCSITRDPVDLRIVQEVETGKTTYGNGIINSQKDVGGWPELKSLPAPADGDHDGMPDSWEKTMNLNPDDPEDRNKIGGGGYTNLELYLNSLVVHDSVIIAPILAKMASNTGIKISQANQQKINLSFPQKSKITVEFFDIKGKRCAVLVDKTMEDGKYTVDYSGLNLSTGSYVCKFSTGNTTFSKKMFLIQ